MGLAFNTDQKFSALKINFLFEFASKVLQGCLSFLGLDMFFMVTQFWYGTKDITFEIIFLFGMYQVLQGYLLWLEVGMITLSD